MFDSKLKKAFKLFAGSKIADIFESKGKIENQSWKENITIYAQDIKGFTSIKEMVSPEELHQLSADYISLTFDTIEKHKGYIASVHGEYVLAYWDENISDSEIHAVDAFNEINTELNNWSLGKKSTALPKLEITVGVVRGSAFIGIYGSQNRKYFSLFGDKVNLAIRLSPANREFDTQLLMTEKVSECIQSKYQTRFVDSVMIKGKIEPIKLYTLV